MGISRKNREILGFTLIELLITVAIISILAGIGLTSLTRANRTARDAQRRGDVQAIRGALEEYYADSNHNSYPGSLGDLDPDYIKSVPVDPTTGGNYIYVLGAGNQQYCVAADLETNPPPQRCPVNGANYEYVGSSRD